nr:carcinine hydrolase/isopenicillin-N N-acyltransferase family protein [uncultured Psychroserpens sp.]
MKKRIKDFLALLIVLFCFYSYNLNACSFFCSARNGNVLMAGNEDWHDPFSKIWTRPSSSENYGIIYLGHSDYQAQIGINEHGLAFDFAAINQVEGKNNTGKTSFYGDLFSELLAKCKTVDEALKYLSAYKFHTPYSQALLVDATGNSILINQDAIIERRADYQISTNFNACQIQTKSYDCIRYNILDQSLSENNPISVSSFRTLLSRVHQEGTHPTQFSYVFDLKKGDIYLYAFHNYENVIKLNVKDELAKGFSLRNLKQLFPPSFEEHYFRTHHKDSLKQSLIKTAWDTEAVEALKMYSAYELKNPETGNYPFMLWDLGADIVKEVWIREAKGVPFHYWWSPKNYISWASNNPKLKEALKIFTFLENIPKDDPKQQIGAYEMKALIFHILDDKEKAKYYFLKTIEVSPENIGNYKRAKLFYNKLKN